MCGVFISISCLALILPARAGLAAAKDPLSPGKGAPQANAAKTHLSLVSSKSIVRKTDLYLITATYPATGNKILDAEVEIWIKEQLATFAHGIEDISTPDRQIFYRMNIDYELYESSAECISLLFRINTYTGNSPWEAPDTGLVTFVYDLKNGRKLALTDIFQEQRELLQFLSDFCREDLLTKLGKSQNERIRKGTNPKPINFQFFVLTPAGLDIYFPPYQVAEASLGEQSVSVPLKALKQFSPLPSLWTGGSRSNFQINGGLPLTPERSAPAARADMKPL